MRVSLRLDGLTGLVMHNVRLADPEDEFARAMKEISDKRKKTDTDRAELARLEYLGGIYYSPDVGVHVPAWNFVKCLNRGGVVTKEGSTILRAVIMLEDRIPLIYDGPKEPAKLFALPEFQWQAIVRIGQSRVKRTRPIFRRWALQAELELADDVMNLDNFQRVVEMAGRSEGLGDGRTMGYGRFTAKVAAA